MAQLFVLSGPDLGRTFTLHPGDVAGRSPECALSLRHASISRRHARFERDGERWFVVDEGSRNGVIHERVRVPRLELTDGIEFQLGELLMRFRSEVTGVSHAPARATPAVAPAAPVAKAIEVDEIELEGEDELPQPSAPTRISAPPPSFAPPPRQEPTITLRTPPPAPASAPRADTGFGPAPGGAGASISRSKERAGERILQYSKVEAKSGLANAELSQLSGTLKLVLTLLAVAVMAGLAWLAFSGTSWLKSRASGEPVEEAPVEPSDG